MCDTDLCYVCMATVYLVSSPRSATHPRPVPEQGERQPRVNPSESCQCITKKISISEPVWFPCDLILWLKRGSFLRQMLERHECCSTNLQTYSKPEDQIQGILHTPPASTLVRYAFNILDSSVIYTFHVILPNSVCCGESHQLPFQLPQSRTSHTEPHTTEVKLTISEWFNIFHIYTVSSNVYTI